MLRMLCRLLLPANARRRGRIFWAGCLEVFTCTLAGIPCSGMYKMVGLFLLKWGWRSAANFLCIVLLAQHRTKRDTSSVNVSHKRSEARDANLCLSVIIPTYNRADMLPALFDSLQNQTLSCDNFEVIVVNNNCSDNTEKVCAMYAPSFRNFRVVHEGAQSLLSARHAGWRAASTDILVFCDDDIEAFPTWLETINSEFLSDPQIGLVGGNNIGKFDSPLPLWFDGLWCVEHGIRLNGWYSLLEGITERKVAPNPGFVFGCNYSIRRQALEAVQGFEPDCMQHVLFQGGGETGISSELAKLYRVILHPGASVYHRMPPERLTPTYMWRRAMFIGATALSTALREGYLPSNKLVDKQKLSSVGRYDFREAEDLENSYAEAVLRFPAFRDWIVRKSYIGHEEPPAEVLAWAQAHVSHSTWHGETT